MADEKNERARRTAKDEQAEERMLDAPVEFDLVRVALRTLERRDGPFLNVWLPEIAAYSMYNGVNQLSVWRKSVGGGGEPRGDGAHLCHGRAPSARTHGFWPLRVSSRGPTRARRRLDPGTSQRRQTWPATSRGTLVAGHRRLAATTARSGRAGARREASRGRPVADTPARRAPRA